MVTETAGSARRNPDSKRILTKGRALSFAIAVIILCGLVAGIVLPRLHDQPSDAPCIRVVTPVSTDNTDAIKALIAHEQDVRIAGLQTLDTSRYPIVYRNDPCIPVGADRVAYIRRVREQYGTEAGMETNGWLAFEVAQIVDRRAGIVSEQQKRDTTAAAANDLQKPTPVPQAIITRKIPIRYDEILVDNDRAEVVYNPGGALRRLFLIRTPDGWRIVGNRIIGECCG